MGSCKWVEIHLQKCTQCTSQSFLQLLRYIIYLYIILKNGMYKQIDRNHLIIFERFSWISFIIKSKISYHFSPSNIEYQTDQNVAVMLKYIYYLSIINKLDHNNIMYLLTYFTQILFHKFPFLSAGIPLPLNNCKIWSSKIFCLNYIRYINNCRMENDYRSDNFINYLLYVRNCN